VKIDDAVVTIGASRWSPGPDTRCESNETARNADGKPSRQAGEMLGLTGWVREPSRRV